MDVYGNGPLRAFTLTCGCEVMFMENENSIISLIR